jgi:hypothetical protein
MPKIETVTELKNNIRQLEYKQAEEWVLLKEQLLKTYNELQPVNIIKNTWHELFSSSKPKINIANSAIGIAAGFITKKVLFGNTHNPLTKLLGLILEMMVANKVAEKGSEIETIGSIILNRFVTKQSGKVSG